MVMQEARERPWPCLYGSFVTTFFLGTNHHPKRTTRTHLSKVLSFLTSVTWDQASNTRTLEGHTQNIPKTMYILVQ